MASIWRKTLIYLGLVEDDEYDELYEDYEVEEEPRTRRSSRRGHHGEARSGAGTSPGVRPLATAGTQARFHLVHPTSFNDAQEVGDRFKEGFSVLMNLTSAEPELARRLIDFASGLAYGLGGAMQPVADKVFLMTPAGVQVSAEERRRFLEERGLFQA